MRILLFLAEGFEEIEAVAPIDVFRRAGINVTTVSISNKLTVTGAHGIGVNADVIFEDADFSGDFLMYLPGGMPGTTNLENHLGLNKLIKKQMEKGQKIAAICAAPSILGKMGLLNQKKAVCYPGFESLLKGATIANSTIVSSDNILTAKGPGVAIPFALKIIEELKGKDTAQQVANAMIL
ncbi:MAG: DJ-1/PfpI family protein [Paludibacter sp.]|nr:DJ-1/PfpI family protein [Paludibacter sp.]MDD4198921.1 DJ-1/PfpI family protein [Paludibacter sp.]MDD4428458.1 DJ-1/PfpI family protein [Paludibacter sp.]